MVSKWCPLSFLWLLLLLSCFSRVDSVRPHRQQPTRLLRPWDFPGKSTGVGCSRLLRLEPELCLNEASPLKGYETLPQTMSLHFLIWKGNKSTSLWGCSGNKKFYMCTTFRVVGRGPFIVSEIGSNLWGILLLMLSWCEDPNPYRLWSHCE